MFTRTRVNSTVIRDAVYNTDTQQLIVTFTNGSVYTYALIPHTMYNRFVNSESKGDFLNTVIKPSCDYIRIV